MASNLNTINFNLEGEKENTYDAIVIGSGISGGWAAKELCEKGLKTLVLERGRNVEHNKDYPTANKHPWEFTHRGDLTEEFVKENPLISKSAGSRKTHSIFLLKIKIIHTFRKNHSTGFVAIRWVASRSRGVGLVSAGVNMSLQHRHDLVMASIGRSVTKMCAVVFTCRRFHWCMWK